MTQSISTSAVNDSLWLTLKNFRVDLPDTDLTFVKRLSRENRWRANYAERVFEEYKKFIYLAVRAGHPVTPSEQVDQAWHLHLVYTRSYWIDLCEGMLGQPLHHGPTRGGQQEDEKYHGWYTRTLASYTHTFGHQPPLDIWPSASERFDPGNRFARLNSKDYWFIKKPSFTAKKPLRAAVIALAIGLPLSACVGTDNSDLFSLTFIVIPIILIIALIAAINSGDNKKRGSSGCGSGCGSSSGSDSGHSGSGCGSSSGSDSGHSGSGCGSSGCGSSGCGSSGCGSSGCGGGGCGGGS